MPIRVRDSNATVGTVCVSARAAGRSCGHLHVYVYVLVLAFELYVARYKDLWLQSRRNCLYYVGAGVDVTKCNAASQNGKACSMLAGLYAHVRKCDLLSVDLFDNRRKQSYDSSENKSKPKHTPFHKIFRQLEIPTGLPSTKQSRVFCGSAAIEKRKH
jgi:hypothetical protein